MLNLDPSVLISRVIILLVSFTIHELAHALTANYFGDPTPRSQGRLTLNPLAHLDVMGSLMLLIAGFGWAKPVQVNPYLLRRRSSSAMMWVSLAGPASNFLLAGIAAIPFRLGLVSRIYADGTILPTLGQFLMEFIFINLLLMLFNLVPLAPLDGEKVAADILPPSWSRVFDQIRPYGPTILLLLLFAAPLIGLDILGWVIYPPLIFLQTLLVG